MKLFIVSASENFYVEYLISTTPRWPFVDVPSTFFEFGYNEFVCHRSHCAQFHSFQLRTTETNTDLGPSSLGCGQTSFYPARSLSPSVLVFEAFTSDSLSYYCGRAYREERYRRTRAAEKPVELILQSLSVPSIITTAFTRSPLHPQHS